MTDVKDGMNLFYVPVYECTWIRGYFQKLNQFSA